MRTRNPFLMLTLALALTGALACEDDDGGEDIPPVLGDGNDDGSDGTPDGDDGSDGSPDGNDDGSDGSPDGNDDGSDGSPDGDDGCNDDPQTSLELLNNCAPAGVERRQFHNAERLPDSYTPGQPLPPLD